jgi:hypothetical protein
MHAPGSFRSSHSTVAKTGALHVAESMKRSEKQALSLAHAKVVSRRIRVALSLPVARDSSPLPMWRSRAWKSLMNSVPARARGAKEEEVEGRSMATLVKFFWCERRVECSVEADWTSTSHSTSGLSCSCK